MHHLLLVRLLTKLDAVEAKYSMETVSSINVYKDILKERLNSVELYYDLSEKKCQKKH